MKLHKFLWWLDSHVCMLVDVSFSVHVFIFRLILYDRITNTPQTSMLVVNWKKKPYAVRLTYQRKATFLLYKKFDFMYLRLHCVDSFLPRNWRLYFKCVSIFERKKLKWCTLPVFAIFCMPNKLRLTIT